MTEELWKLVSIGLLLGVLGVSGKLWLTDRDLNQAKTDLAVAQQSIVNLRVGIDEQNKAIQDMKTERDNQIARADAAWQNAMTMSNRWNIAMQKVQNQKPIKCEEAMPLVDQVIEAVR